MWRARLLSVSSPRKRGPIRRALSIGLGLWVPACAGTTAERMLRLTLFCSHVKQRDRHAGLAPVALLGRGGSPVFRSFSFPNARGGAPRSACPGFRQGGPGVTGRTTRTGPGRIMRDAIQRSKCAPRGIAPLIAFTAAGPAGPCYPGRLLPGWPPEVVAGVSNWPRSRVPHPVPPSQRLMKAPSRGRDVIDIGGTNRESKIFLLRMVIISDSDE